jgi:precorrin-8X/cobalt-precorrin-8 methylmutase
MAPIMVTLTVTVITIITAWWSEVVSRPLFDSYLMVDWSAANMPRCGRDSIWFCLLQRERGQLKETALENPSTRHRASCRLLEVLIAAIAEKRSILVGFDFPLGFSRGLAAKLALAGPAWRAVWDDIAKLLSDDERNRNNRFAVAAELNRRVSGAAFPFWGCPPRQAGPCLAPTHHRQHGAGQLAERRLVEARVRGPQPGWKLLGIGSAGSQALTGIPIVRRLRDHPALAAAAKVWPFETGLGPLGENTGTGRVVLAEIYPSLIPNQPRGGEVKDSAQVRATARHFAQLDERDGLAETLAGDPGLTHEQRETVTTEEGWVLGVTNGVARRPRPPIAIAIDPALGRRRPRDKPTLPLAGAGRGEVV